MQIQNFTFTPQSNQMTRINKQGMKNVTFGSGYVDNDEYNNNKDLADIRWKTDAIKNDVNDIKNETGDTNKKLDKLIEDIKNLSKAIQNMKK